MTWFLIALIAPFLWSTINHADKYLISKYSKDTGVGGLAIFSSLFAIFVLPIVYLVDRDILRISLKEAFFLTATGFFMALAILFYLYALERDDASHVVPFWFLVPVFAYLFGILVLNEYINENKIIGAMITLCGAIILSLEFDEGISVKFITVLLMISSSVFIALSDVIFKNFALNITFWSSIFWNQVGMVIFGLVCILGIKKYRKDFFKVCRANTKEIVALNIGGEIMQTIASIFNYYSMLLAPVALVLLVSYTFQPLFVFFEGIIISMFFPKIAQEHLSTKHSVQKLVSVAIMSFGVYMIIMTK